MSSRNRVTLSEVVEQSRVSLPTVSLVLRDKPGVGAVTRRQRVLCVTKKRSYLPKNSVQHNIAAELLPCYLKRGNSDPYLLKPAVIQYKKGGGERSVIVCQKTKSRGRKFGQKERSLTNPCEITHTGITIRFSK